MSFCLKEIYAFLYRTWDATGGIRFSWPLFFFRDSSWGLWQIRINAACFWISGILSRNCLKKSRWPMRILGIDPGSRKTGWAVVELQGKKINYLASGVLRFDQVDRFLDRLVLIFKVCVDLKAFYKPDEISIESLIYVKSVDALSKLAQARGAMIAAFSDENAQNIYEYAPNLIKASVTGHGHASKESVDKTLTMMFGKIPFKSSDESDALSIAVCHALTKAHYKTKKQEVQV